MVVGGGSGCVVNAVSGPVHGWCGNSSKDAEKVGGG